VFFKKFYIDIFNYCKNDELNQANGGKVDVAGDNIPIFFNGDHHHLKKQICFK